MFRTSSTSFTSCLTDGWSLFRNQHQTYHPPSHHHHGPSSTAVFGIPLSRLRQALYYFIFAIVFTTFLYCLVFYQAEIIRRHPRSRIRYPLSSSSISSNSIDSDEPDFKTRIDSSISGGGAEYRQSIAYLLENFISNANIHYVDNYRQRKLLVPFQLNQKNNMKNYTIKYNVELPNNTNSIKNTQKEDDLVQIHLLDSSGEEDILTQFDSESDSDYLELVDEPDSVEHYLEHLGFNIRHITRYLLEHSNQTIGNRSRTWIHKSSIKSITMPNSTSTNNSLNKLFADIKQSSVNNRIIWFVTAVNSNQYSQVYRFIRSFERYRQTLSKVDNSILRLIIFDLNLSIDQHFEISSLCNRTSENETVLCTIQQFHFELYPSHVANLKISAYRSIIIQEMLRDIHRARIVDNRFSSPIINNEEQLYNLIWLDPHYRFLPNSITQSPFKLNNLLLSTRNISGIESWPIEQPTSSLTHPRMFDYFHTTMDNFYFHRMIRSNHLVISIDSRGWQSFQYGIMLPWVRCALTEDCIAPLGSQWRSSCRLDKKPHYRYSGCHHYDMSILNVVLGIAFNYSSSEYWATPSSRFFAPFYKLIKSTNLKEDVNLEPTQTTVNENKFILKEDDFDYSDYDPESLIHHLDEFNLEWEERFDRVLADDDLPEDQRVQIQKRPLSTSTIFHQQKKSLSQRSSHV